jgi:ABC-2 type transport system ATP-binding protein
MIVSQNQTRIQGVEPANDYGPPVLQVQGLRKAYGSTVALDGVDLEVAAGEIVGLLGPNGAGKTTLVSIVAGLRGADGGSVRIGGIDALAHSHRARPLLGLAPQETGIYPTLTCRDNLRFFGELTGLRSRELRAAVESVAEALQLTELLERRAQHLSGGERRRLHTALALVHRPALVMLDEPTTGADVRTRSQLLQLVNDLAANGSAVVYSTHYLAEIDELGASVVIMDRGQAIARGTVAALVDAHAADVVQMTFGGPAPDVRPNASGDRIEREGPILRIHTRNPDAATAMVIEGLGDRATQLRTIEVVRPSLEAVFLELTGRRYAPAVDTESEVDHVH